MVGLRLSKRHDVVILGLVVGTALICMVGLRQEIPGPDKCVVARVGTALICTWDCDSRIGASAAAAPYIGLEFP
jgi:hypothetical protein